MVQYSSGGPIQVGPQYPAGSVEARLGVCPDTQTVVIHEPMRSQLPSDLARFYPEFDGLRTQGERDLARQQRIAQEQADGNAELKAAGDAALATGQAPAGFVIVSHSDKTSTCSLAHPLGDGYHVCRHDDLEIVRAHGFVSKLKVGSQA